MDTPFQEPIRSKSGASKSRPRWAAHTKAHTRIGNVWEYPSPGLKVIFGHARPEQRSWEIGSDFLLLRSDRRERAAT